MKQLPTLTFPKLSFRPISGTSFCIDFLAKYITICLGLRLSEFFVYVVLIVTAYRIVTYRNLVLQFNLNQPGNFMLFFLLTQRLVHSTVPLLLTKSDPPEAHIQCPCFIQASKSSTY
uniref:Uncharacterized protein n=1 Tax=Onchocerca volvulus TaxID=6282 RepID=A0A8R1TSG4_ONCVO